MFLSEITRSLSLFRPEVALVATFIVALLFDLIFAKSKNIAGFIALIGFVVTGFLLYDQTGVSEGAFAKMLVVDPFATIFKFIVLIASFIVVIMSFFSKELYDEDRRLGEYFILIVGMTFGMFLLSGATNLILVYLAIETMSISSYVLAGYTKEVKRASEASLKYVIFGAVSSGVMIYGISMIYGFAGTLNLLDLQVAAGAILSGGLASAVPFVVGGLLVIAGIGYKISAVPFHFWTPDVYEGAPVTITAYLSVASKAAGFALLIRFLHFVDLGEGVSASLGALDWQMFVAVLSALTMTLGNLVALWQTNLKRMLAYSSIAHAGYILMGVVVMNETGYAAVMIYFIVYLIMNLGAFAVVMLLANRIGSEELEDYQGIGYRAPFLSACMVVFMISLTGLPPTAGFIGKLEIFTAVLQAGSEWIWLLVFGILNSVVSLFYYVRVFRNMFVRGVDTEEGKEAYEFSPGGLVLVFALAVPTILFGIYWGPIVNWAKNSALLFAGG